jgi:hypothetical protein
MSEANQTKWVGIRPINPIENIFTQVGAPSTTEGGKTRVFISKSVEVNNTTTIIHTVTAAKTFYLCSCSCSANSGVSKLSHLKVRNATDVDQYIILDFESAAASAIGGSLTFNPPLAIIAGFDIVLTTDNAHASGFIYGWEE